jgi:uncharacterized PurR-regulated membrane protein YhhQ (DUF165 family)
VKAYEYRGGTARVAVAALGVERPVRPAGAAAWPPRGRAYGGEAQDLLSRYARPIRIASRLAMPVMLLAVLLGAAFLYSDALLLLPRAPRFVQNSTLTMSDLVLPMAWTAIHLTNRRHGAAYAFGQLVAGLCLLGLVALINPYNIAHWVAASPVLSWRGLLAFGAAFLLANFIAIVVFDAVRGPDWWFPPMAASLAASLMFSLVYFPAAFAGETAWTTSAMVHFALFFGESLFLLMPYGLLRPAMRPLHGMNGY